MQPLINLSEPFSILVALVLFVLILILAKETKRSVIVGIMLIAFLAIIVGHTVEYIVVGDMTETVKVMLSRCIGMDFIFIFLSFISYLWVDDIETKDKKKKSIDNSLDWFWKKV